MIILFCSCFVAILISFLCSLAEAVLLSANTPVEQKSKDHTTVKTWTKLKANIGRPIAAILILNTIAHTGGATIAAGAFQDLYGERWLWIFSITFTTVILFGTELLPKILGISYNQKLIPIIAKPLDIITLILMPIIWLTDIIAKKFNTVPHKPKTMTMDEMIALVNLARINKLIENEQENIIVNTMELHKNYVENIMIPKEKIIYLQLGTPIDEMIKIIESSLHTYYPVTETKLLDDAQSYINVKTILSQLRNNKLISSNQITKPIMRIYQNMTLVDLLKLLIDEKQQMALVLDNEKKVVGLVTIKDVIREILSENNSDSITDIVETEQSN